MSITVGQTLYMPYKNRVIKEATVTKVSRTYFYTDLSRQDKVLIKTLVYTNPVHPQYGYSLYTSKQEILDMWEIRDLINSIRVAVSNGLNGLSLAKLKRINDALLSENV